MQLGYILPSLALFGLLAKPVDTCDIDANSTIWYTVTHHAQILEVVYGN